MSQGPVRRLAGMNSPATRSSAGFVMREIQTGLHKPEGGTKQPLTKSADNSAPVCFPNCALICLGSRISFDLPLALATRAGEVDLAIIREDRRRPDLSDHNKHEATVLRVPGTPYLTAWANSVPGTPYLTAWANSGKSGERTGIAADGHPAGTPEQTGVERLGHERTLKGERRRVERNK